MLTLWKPNRELMNWSKDFEDLWNAPFSNGERMAMFSPAVDVEETDAALVLSADLPGIDKKDISVRISDGVLTLSGTREEQTEQKKKGHLFRERRYGSFARSFRLGPNVASDQIDASYKDGVLTVTLPKKEEAKPKQVAVKIN